MKNRDVAQLGSAPALGAGCRRFESCHPDSKRFASYPGAVTGGGDEQHWLPYSKNRSSKLAIEQKTRQLTRNKQQSPFGTIPPRAESKQSECIKIGNSANATTGQNRYIGNNLLIVLQVDLGCDAGRMCWRHS